MSDENEKHNSNEFSEEQKNYLQGFALGSDVARAVRGLPVISDSAAADGSTIALGSEGAAVFHGPDQIHHEAFQNTESSGGKLCKEEQAKREKNSLDMWTEMEKRANAGEFPTGTDVFLMKAHGLFYVAPAQNSYMCRMRVPGGHLNSQQVRGISGLAGTFAGGYADVTTRNNLPVSYTHLTLPTKRIV